MHDAACHRNFFTFKSRMLINFLNCYNLLRGKLQTKLLLVHCKYNRKENANISYDKKL